MKSILTTIVLVLAAFSTHAGSSVAQLDCKSASGRTKVQGVIPNYASYELNLTFTIDQSKTVFFYEEAGKYAEVVENKIPNKGTLKMNLFEDQASGHLKMTAIEKSIKYQKSKYGYQASFNAIISAESTDPRSALPISEATKGQDIYVACTLVDEI